MVWFYSQEEADRLSARARAYKTAALCTGGAALVACVALCFLIRTGNAARMTLTIIGLSTIGGWTVILLMGLGGFPARAELKHTEGILTGPRVSYEGSLTVTDKAFAIPKSVTVRTVRLEQGERPVPLQVDARFADRLPENGTRVRVITVHRFIAAFEVLHA